MNPKNAQRHLNFVEKLAKFLDSGFGFGPFKFGADPLIGLIPWIGDIFTAIISLYIYWIAVQFGAPKSAQYKILRNTIFDFVLGLIPIIGDASDFVYRSNRANMKILKEHLDKT